MKKIANVEVNTFNKAYALTAALKKAGRLAWYDEFFTFTGKIYLIWYRTI